MRLTQKKRAIAQAKKAEFLARAAELQQLDQSALDQDPNPDSVTVDGVEFEKGGETQWRTGNATYDGEGAVLAADFTDEKVVFEGEVNNIFGYRNLSITEAGENIELKETFTSPMKSTSTSITYRSADGVIVAFQDTKS